MPQEKGGIHMNRRTFLGAAGVSGGLLAKAIEPAEAASTPLESLQATPIDQPITPTEWDVIGPFQYGIRDYESGYLFEHGGEDDYADGKRTTGNHQFGSAVGTAGKVEWETVEGSVAADGTVTVPTNFYDSSFGVDGAMGFGLFKDTGYLANYTDYRGWAGLYQTGYAFTTFEASEAGTALARIEGASKFWLNGRVYNDGSSGLGTDRVPVAIEPGTNYLLVKTTVVLAGLFGGLSVTLAPPSAPVEITEPVPHGDRHNNGGFSHLTRVFAPNLRKGESVDEWAAVTVLNATTDRIEGAELTVGAEASFLQEQTVEIDPLAPLEVRRVPVPFRTADLSEKKVKSLQKEGTVSSEQTKSVQVAETPPDEASETGQQMASSHAQSSRVSGDNASSSDSTSDTTSIEVTASETAMVATVTAEGASVSRKIPLLLKDPATEHYITTFRSGIDESVQKYGIKRPVKYNENRDYGLIVNLHGASVKATIAGAFGHLDDAFVVAPTNRGPYGFDWQDWGRLDALEVIDEVTSQYNIDEDRITVVGHSMGGHGTMHVGLTYADRFAGIAPQHGWIDFPTYIPGFLGQDDAWAHPDAKAVQETVLFQEKGLPLTENARNLNVFLQHGAKDTSVNPEHPRAMFRALGNMGLSTGSTFGNRRSSNPDVQVEYLEVPGVGHIWNKGLNDEEYPNAGGDWIAHPDVINFARSQKRDPMPEEIQFQTSNLRVKSSHYWVTVTEQADAHGQSRVRAHRSGRVETENVQELQLDAAAVGNAVTIDGDDVSASGTGTATYRKEGGTWSRTSGPRGGQFRKNTEQYGHIREAYFSPFRLVYGTQGSDLETEVTRNVATYRADQWARTGKGYTQVIPDTDVTQETMENYNLVLFGRPESNSVLDAVHDDLPVDLRDGSIDINGESYDDEAVARMVYPNPKAPDNEVLVNAGTTPTAVRLATLNETIKSHMGDPDFVVFDENTRWRSWGGYLAAGFFDKDWEINPDRSYFRSGVDLR